MFFYEGRWIVGSALMHEEAVIYVTQYIPLTDAEAQAIAYHDGQYIDDNKVVAHKEEPLTLLLHWADYWTAHIYEGGSDKMNISEMIEE